MILSLVGLYFEFGRNILPKKTAQYSGHIEKVRVGVAEAGAQFSSLIVVAARQGFFKDNGLDVTLSHETSGVNGIKSLLSGQQDIITASDFAFVNSNMSNTSLRIIASIDKANEVEVIARKDKGIGTAIDLKGKRIGVVPQTAADFVLVRFLLYNNLSKKDIVTVNLTYENMQQSIVDGKVDAVIVNDPWAYNIKKTIGKNAISWDAQYGQALVFNAIATEGYIRANPEVIERFLTALISAEEFAASNPDIAKQNVLDEFKLDKEFLDQSWPKNNLAVSLDQSTVFTLESQARWLISNMFPKNSMPNFLDRIYIDGLKKISPNRVTII